jgi:hypothetical protein
VARLSDWRPDLDIAAVQPRLIAAFACRFGLDLRPPRQAERLEGW